GGAGCDRPIAAALCADRARGRADAHRARPLPRIWLLSDPPELVRGLINSTADAGAHGGPKTRLLLRACLRIFRPALPPVTAAIRVEDVGRREIVGENLAFRRLRSFHPGDG